MTLNKFRYFIYENYHKQIEFLKETSYNSVKQTKKNNLLLLATKLIEKIPYLANAIKIR